MKEAVPVARNAHFQRSDTRRTNTRFRRTQFTPQNQRASPETDTTASDNPLCSTTDDVWGLMIVRCPGTRSRNDVFVSFVALFVSFGPLTGYLCTFLFLSLRFLYPE